MSVNLKFDDSWYEGTFNIGDLVEVFGRFDEYNGIIGIIQNLEGDYLYRIIPSNHPNSFLRFYPKHLKLISKA